MLMLMLMLMAALHVRASDHPYPDHDTKRCLRVESVDEVDGYPE
jgi:hypothetical protein